MANSCQNSVATKALTNNIQPHIHSQAQNLANHCQDNQTRDTKLSLTKPIPTKPSQDWQSIGDVLGTSASKSIIEQIISNVELAKSCQNDQTQDSNSNLSSSKVNLANPCQNDQINQNPLVNSRATQNNELVANQRIGNSLPTSQLTKSPPTSIQIQTIPNSLEANKSTSSNTSTSPSTSRSNISPRQAMAMLKNRKRF